MLCHQRPSLANLLLRLTSLTRHWNGRIGIKKGLTQLVMSNLPEGTYTQMGLVLKLVAGPLSFFSVFLSHPCAVSLASPTRPVLFQSAHNSFMLIVFLGFDGFFCKTLLFYYFSPWFSFCWSFMRRRWYWCCILIFLLFFGFNATALSTRPSTGTPFHLR